MKLFFIPFGGGSEFSYRDFKKKLDWKGIEPVFISLPGRGARMAEPLEKTVEGLVEDVYRQVIPHVGGEYAFFGHSMGSLLSLLTTQKLSLASVNLPRHLFVSGRAAPPVNSDDNYSAMSKEDFWDTITKWGGMPKTFLEEPDLVDFYEPILRADLEALENYKYRRAVELDIPMTVMMGKEDKATRDEMELWRKESSGQVEIHEFEGGHFFIFDHLGKIFNLVSSKLSPRPFC